MRCLQPQIRRDRWKNRGLPEAGGGGVGFVYNEDRLHLGKVKKFWRWMVVIGHMVR